MEHSGRKYKTLHSLCFIRKGFNDYLVRFFKVVRNRLVIFQKIKEPHPGFINFLRNELALFEIRAESELDFFFRKATFPKNVFIQMILFKHIVHTKP